ncbi:hypothetical protein BASA83_003741 [Batrachochytrium salamandrivorans]|nr:hypothetical protein BASA83_003741 [Batrachochytrium salamandrivorans]
MQGARIRTSAVRDIRWISRQVVQLLVDADYVSAFTRIITSLDATIVKSFKAWVPRSEAADKDKLAAISSFAAKTVTTIQRSPDTLEAATAEAAKIRVQTPGFDISTMETVPKESLPVKKVTDKEPAAPAVDPPLDTAAEITPAIQVDGVTPTVTPIADVEMCFRLESLPPLHSRSNPGSPDGACLQDRPPYHKTRCSISHNGPLKTDNATSSSASSAKASKPTGVFGKTTDIAVQTSLDQQPHLHHYHGRFLAVNVANISNKRPAIRHIVRNTRLWAISETCITSSKFRFTVPGFDVIQHPATGPGRRGIALGIPSCFGGHEHGSAVGTMILAKVPNFTPECLWIVGSVYVGHSGATTNYSRREAFASIRQSLDRVVPFDNNHPVLIFGDWNTEPAAPSTTRTPYLATCGQTDSSGRPLCHSHIHSSRRLKDNPLFLVLQPYPAIIVSKPPDRIATSNYWDVLADGASDDTDTDTDVHQLTSQFLESANAVADQLSLRLSPPATRFNRRLLSGTTKRAILTSNTARQAFIAAATNTQP